MASRKLFALVSGVRSLIESSAETIDFSSIKVGADGLEISQSGSGGSALFNFNSRKLGGIVAGTATGHAVEYDQFNTGLGLYVPLTQKGAANGVATLDGAGKIPSSQLTVDAMEYKGLYDADTNTPSLADGVGNTGDTYIVSVAGTQDFGSGNIDLVVGNFLIYNGSTWQTVPSAMSVTSVNGFTGVVVLDTDDIDEGSTNLYYTQGRFDSAFAAKDTDDLAEGSSNLYFTNARAIAAPLTGYSSGAGTVAATDSILQAIQKLNGNQVAAAAAAYQPTLLSAENDNASTISAGEIAYVKSDGKVDLAVASSSFVAGKLAVVKDATIAAAATGSLHIQQGTPIAGSGLTPGAPVYLDPSTPGAITQTQPSTVNQWIVQLGEAVSAS